ncbi:hypothetical protein, partial [Acinetobacter variabilis]|uniref:hypothetical protein n=1 Tax=Acinetobacter variabilis TaxID=70346 RepID=UPI0030F9409D
IHLVREGSKTQTISERIESVKDVLVENEFSPSKLYAAEAIFMEGFTYSYGEYKSYIYPNALNLDRFLLIFTFDQVNR